MSVGMDSAELAAQELATWNGNRFCATCNSLSRDERTHLTQR